jgi:hypothetical protein
MNCEWLSLRGLSIIFEPMLGKTIGRITQWEKWPFALLYFPISFVWVWYMIRSRAVWFFTPSNPTIEFGGFEGEGKKEMYLQLPPETIPQSIFIQHTLPFSEVVAVISAAGFTYPFVVKPDVGMKGILFRKIDNEEQLLRYHEKIPVEYIVQEMVDLPMEVSVFYFRHPKSDKGTISGFILKELLHVKGDGVSSLSRLVREHPRAKYRIDEMVRKHGHRFDRIPEKDEIFYLSYAGNHNRGAKFTNLKHEIDESLLNVFDSIGNHAKHFYYGRYDIKITSIEDLKAGQNFKILEYNGSGAEPNHIYDCNMSLIDAYKEILRHWKALYEISAHNHKNGFPYWSFKKGYRFLKSSNRHFKILSKFE